MTNSLRLTPGSVVTMVGLLVDRTVGCSSSTLLRVQGGTPMPKKRFLSAFVLPAALFLSRVVADAWAAPNYQVLHAFTGGKDGGGLFGPLLLDADGDLYGTTIAGGPKGKGGTVFELDARTERPLDREGSA